MKVFNFDLKEFYCENSFLNNLLKQGPRGILNFVLIGLFIVVSFGYLILLTFSNLLLEENTLFYLLISCFVIGFILTYFIEKMVLKKLKYQNYTLKIIADDTALRIEDSRFENVNVIEYSAIEEIYKVYLGFYLVEDLRKVVDTTEDYFYVTLYGHLDLVNCVHSESFKHNNFEGIPITILKLPIMDNHKNNLLSFIEEKLNKECTKVDF